MEELGIPFSVMKPGIDEKAVRHADPKQLPVVVALAKAKVGDQSSDLVVFLLLW